MTHLVQIPQLQKHNFVTQNNPSEPTVNRTRNLVELPIGSEPTVIGTDSQPSCQLQLHPTGHATASNPIQPYTMQKHCLKTSRSSRFLLGTLLPLAVLSFQLPPPFKSCKGDSCVLFGCQGETCSCPKGKTCSMDCGSTAEWKGDARKALKGRCNNKVFVGDFVTVSCVAKLKYTGKTDWERGQASAYGTTKSYPKHDEKYDPDVASKDYRDDCRWALVHDPRNADTTNCIENQWEETTCANSTFTGAITNLGCTGYSCFGARFLGEVNTARCTSASSGYVHAHGARYKDITTGVSLGLALWEWSPGWTSMHGRYV